MTASHNKECFPRTPNIPTQSPKYWVKEKDRYLRQLLIRDIQEKTERELVVYFTNSGSGQIDFRDADDISEVLADCKTREVDLIIQTPGGNIDACEKLISVLKQRTDSYRVIVPSWAKSAGTIIALSSYEVVMGVNSELGPIDPQFNGIPAEFIQSDPQQNHPTRKIAENAVVRTKHLASQVLSENMLSEKTQKEVEDIVNQLGSAQSYFSHGAVINAHAASELGLSIKYLEPNDDLWCQLWFLYCMYDYDCHIKNLSKIFEGARFSISKPIPAPVQSQK